ncbi:MAG: hypothetical protein HY902_15335, partial [Deltaproteobacteria bacterium]|nr:hypothetical protein [Deltaproteobacteria bacterium]
MRPEMKSLPVALWVVAVGLGACGGGETLTCAKGTQQVGGACVAEAPVDACGAGTVKSGSQCLPAGADAEAGDNGDTADAQGDVQVDVPGDASAAACDPPCAKGQVCLGGVCEQPSPPPGWACSSEKYADGAACHCGCGAADPDCADAGLAVVGCASGKCEPDGTCSVCKADCAGKECGDNGCGGSCGGCFVPGKTSCVAGTCQACQPKCTDKACGDDGCGGTCGSCGQGLSCQFGACVDPPAAESCVGHCGGTAPSGCACTADCAKKGNCCVDVGNCACLPECKDKQCGDDGCGGTCGDCAPGSACSSGKCLTPVCTDATCNGHGVCQAATVQCDCAPGYAGAACDGCAPGLVGYPNCGTPCTDDAGCDDANPCTDDACSAGVSCVHLAGDGTCTDGEFCTGGDACVAGTCKPGTASPCDDKNACTADSCDSKLGCVYLASAATSCEDGDPCTMAETCSGTTCGGGKPTNCDDGNLCSTDSCDSAVPGGCVYEPSGLVCELGDPCSEIATCTDLACTSASAKNCDDGNDCTVDACLATSGQCTHQPGSANAPCDDHDFCTTGDACNAQGQCGAGATICALTVTAGLVGHFSAASPSSLITAGGDQVVGWQDLSGKEHHLAPVDAGAVPKRVAAAFSGRPGVRLTDSKGLSSEAFAVASAASVFATVCFEDGAASGTVAAHGSAGQGWQVAQSSQSNASVAQFVAGTQTAGSGQKIQAGHCYVLAGRVGSAATELMQIETVAAASSVAGATLATDSAALHLGTGSAGDTGGVIVGELLYFDRYVTDAERDSIATYLRLAWGFAPPVPDFAWYDAADLATVATGTGQTVTKWQDKSGLGRDAVVGTNSAPVWYATATGNGQPAIRFDGGTVRLQTSPVPTSPTMTVFAVYELDATAPWGSIFNQGHDTYFSLRKTETKADSLNWHIAANNDAPLLPLDLGKWRLLTAVQDSATSTAYHQPDQPQQTKQGPIAAGSEK